MLQAALMGADLAIGLGSKLLEQKSAKKRYKQQLAAQSELASAQKRIEDEAAGRGAEAAAAAAMEAERGNAAALAGQRDVVAQEIGMQNAAGTPYAARRNKDMDLASTRSSDRLQAAILNAKESARTRAVYELPGIASRRISAAESLGASPDETGYGQLASAAIKDFGESANGDGLAGLLERLRRRGAPSTGGGAGTKVYTPAAR